MDKELEDRLTKLEHTVEDQADEIKRLQNIVSNAGLDTTYDLDYADF